MATKQFRVCASENCKVRLPDFKYDGHSRCSTCIGQVCNFNNHCLECADWPNDVFDRYVKHRHVLELTRLRKAKQRSKAKQSLEVSKLPVSAHSVSPSPSVSVVSLSPSSSISAYSPSAITQTLSSTPTAVTSAPQGDQVVTRSEFDSLKLLMATMASDLAALRRGNDEVHSESVPPPSLAVPPTSGVEARSADPSVSRMILSPVEGCAEPVGEPSPTEACPRIQQETLLADRSRKRVRDIDSVERKKRQRSPSRERGSTTARTPELSRHAPFALTGATLSSRAPTGGTPVPLSALPSRLHSDTRASPSGTSVPKSETRLGDGSFSESMILTLESLIESTMARNPKLSAPEAMDIAKGYLRVNDPHNLSYSSARSGQGAQGRKTTASAGVSVTGNLSAFDLGSKEGGVCCRKV